MMRTPKVYGVDMTDTFECASWLFSALKPDVCVVCKNDQWYIWTKFETLIPTDDPDYDLEYCHDYEERQDSRLYLTKEFGKIIGVQFENSRLYLWVEG